MKFYVALAIFAMVMTALVSVNEVEAVPALISVGGTKEVSVQESSKFGKVSLTPFFQLFPYLLFC